MNPQTSPTADMDAVLHFGDCELHVLTHELWRNGQKQAIRRLVFDLMVCLLKHRPKPVPHAQIAKAVWGRVDVRPSLMAQAIMEARQVTGDDPDTPKLFVSVRGVGYRFASAVAQGAVVAVGSNESMQSELSAIAATLAEGEAAVIARDKTRAQFLAERAMALADAAGVNRERSLALSLAALVALNSGTLEQAASLSTRALLLAEAEGHVAVAALARIRLGRVRMAAGDMHGALTLFNQAYGHLDTPQWQHERLRCETFLSLAHRELKQFDLALQWCLRSKETAYRVNPVNAAMTERTAEIDVMLSAADNLRQEGRLEESKAKFQQALANNEALRPDVHRATDLCLTLCWFGNQSTSLAGLDQLEDAWKMAEATDQALQAWPDKSGHAYLHLASSLHALRANLYARSSRFAEAMASVEQSVEALEAAGYTHELPRVLGVASDICERAGQFEKALSWMRRSLAAHSVIQSRSAATLALVIHAEAQTDSLRRELQAAREQAQQLALENRDLGERLRQLERARRTDAAGFTDALLLRSMLTPQHADARLRDVPFCLAMVHLDNYGALADQIDETTRLGLLRKLADAFAEFITPAQEVAHWRPGHFVLLLGGMGERRAREVCGHLALQLNARQWLTGSRLHLPLAPQFSVDCVDAARGACIDQALAELQQTLHAESPRLSELGA